VQSCPGSSAAVGCAGATFDSDKPSDLSFSTDAISRTEPIQSIIPTPANNADQKE